MDGVRATAVTPPPVYHETGYYGWTSAHLGTQDEYAHFEAQAWRGVALLLRVMNRVGSWDAWADDTLAWMEHNVVAKWVKRSPGQVIKAGYPQLASTWAELLLHMNGLGYDYQSILEDNVRSGHPGPAGAASVRGTDGLLAEYLGQHE